MNKRIIAALLVALMGEFMGDVAMAAPANGWLTDEDIVMQFTVDERGQGNYEINYCDDYDEDGMIEYSVLKDGKPFVSGSLNRDHYRTLYSM